MGFLGWARSVGILPVECKNTGSGMFVRRNWLAKRHVSQVLQRIRQGVIRRITRLPEPVAFGEFLRGKRRQSQQIIRSVLDHVDAQIVSRVDAEVRPVRVAEREPLQLDQPIE